MSNKEEPYDVEKDTATPASEGVTEPVATSSEEPSVSEEKVVDEETDTPEAYDPATTPAPNRDKKKLSKGWFITGIILLLVVITGMVVYVVASVNDTNESRDVINSLKLDDLGMKVVEDSIDGNHFLISGSDSSSQSNFYARCELEKYTIGDVKKGLVFCEGNFLAEANIGGEN